MEIRPIHADYREALAEFGTALPRQDVVFADPALISPVAVASWTQAVPEQRLIAVDEASNVMGMITVDPGVGWSDHVGEIRLVVLPEYRGRGVGRALADRGLEMARSLGLAKVTVAVTATNTGGMAMFEALGFTEEARLGGQVRDHDGTYHDLVILGRWLNDDDEFRPSGSS